MVLLARGDLASPLTRAIVLPIFEISNRSRKRRRSYRGSLQSSRIQDVNADGDLNEIESQGDRRDSIYVPNRSSSLSRTTPRTIAPLQPAARVRLWRELPRRRCAAWERFCPDWQVL